MPVLRQVLGGHGTRWPSTTATARQVRRAYAHVRLPRGRDAAHTWQHVFLSYPKPQTLDGISTASACHQSVGAGVQLQRRMPGAQPNWTCPSEILRTSSADGGSAPLSELRRLPPSAGTPGRSTPVKGSSTGPVSCDRDAQTVAKCKQGRPPATHPIRTSASALTCGQPIGFST